MTYQEKYNSYKLLGRDILGWQEKKLYRLYISHRNNGLTARAFNHRVNKVRMGQATLDEIMNENVDQKMRGVQSQKKSIRQQAEEIGRRM